MLVLTRKLGEKITIGDDVVLTIIALRGDKVRIGFEAPDKVEIHREEVYRKIREERESEEGGDGA